MHLYRFSGKYAGGREGITEFAIRDGFKTIMEEGCLFGCSLFTAVVGLVASLRDWQSTSPPRKVMPPLPQGSYTMDSPK
jgi:hypothetical protein